MDVYLTSSELYSDGTVHMNAYNLKGDGAFDGKFPFDFVVILGDLLSNKVIIINLQMISSEDHFQ